MKNFAFVNPLDIVVAAGRQRQTFDASMLKKLQESIEEYGILQPPVVEEQPDGKFLLIAGERRLRAMRSILEKAPESNFLDDAPSGLVPVIFRSQLDEETRFAMELEENIQREDLPFLEKALAIDKLHKLRNKQPEGQTIAETAQEVRATPSTIADSLLIAKHADNPAVQKAATAKEAVKVIRKEAETAHRAELAKKFDLTKTPHLLIQGRAEDEVEKFPDQAFDVICTDPPYGIDADEFGDQASTGHDYKDSYEEFKKMLQWFPDQTYRVAKHSAFAYIFCAYERFEELKDAMGLAGWNVWKRPFIWDKQKTGMVPVPDKGPRYSYECILYAWKGERKVVRQAMPDVLSYAPPKRLLHAAQKPAALLSDLLSRVALPGDKALDLYVGSGSIFLACNSLRLVATAVELDEAQYNNALLRINDRLEAEPLDAAPDLVI